MYIIDSHSYQEKNILIIHISEQMYFYPEISQTGRYCDKIVSDKGKAMTLFIIIYPYYGYIQLMTHARCIFVYTESISRVETMVCMTTDDNGLQWINNCIISFFLCQPRWGWAGPASKRK